MAPENGSSSDPLTLRDRLARAARRFDFFEALRRLERAHPDKPRLGRARRPADEPVRLGQEASLAFAPSTLSSFEPGREGAPDRLGVLFFGLFGPHGPLPLHLTEYARQRQRTAGDSTFAAFADLFHHRMLCLYYRARAEAEPAIAGDRPGEDRFRVYVGALAGRGTPGTWDKDGIDDASKRFFAAHLGSLTRHPAGLECMLTDLFGVSARLEEFCGEWLEIPDEGRWRLGESPESGTLGRTISIGARIWSVQHRFRIVLGPMSLERFRALLPGEPALPSLADLVRNHVGDELDWELALVLRRDEVPTTRLGSHTRLGWTSWLNEGTPERDAEDVVLTSSACRA